MGADRNVAARVGIGSPSQAAAERRASLAFSARRELELLARHWRADLRGLERAWLERCAERAELDEEDPAYVAAVTRNAKPLFDTLGAGRADLAELHAAELFHDLRALGFAISATLLVIDCLHAALAEAPRGEHSANSENDELRRFLTRVAVDVATTSSAGHNLVESEERPRAALSRNGAARTLLGSSPRLLQLRRELADVADAPGATLIVGESGSGKELVAQALHQLARRRERPFLAINCAALPRELIESELFGYERGAFTGSRESAPGLLRAAGEGTVFLDEIAEMPQELQPKLLRALEQRAVRPIGGVKELPFHARVVAATNRDPELAVRSGQLRTDLFYRLCVHRLDVPALRDRLQDLPELARHFLLEVAGRGHQVPLGFGADSLAVLLEHDWPGNVRELRNVVEHCCATAKSVPIAVEHLPRYLRRCPTGAQASGTFRCAPASPAAEPAPWSPIPLQELERDHISRALSATGGNKASAARLLGISRHQLYVRLERLGLSDERD
jgi:DNA-binding NtrC family response regulator